MSIKKDELGISILIPLAIGAISGFLTNNAMEAFRMKKQPPLSPPGWLFPVVWTILYILMGVASYIIYQKSKGTDEGKTALRFYGIQLFFNFFWSVFFFNLEWYLFALIWLLALLVFIIITAIKFGKIDKTAAYLMIPYILWVTFAGYLNLGVYLLN